MHNYEPNHHYHVLTVEIVVDADVNRIDIIDEINAILDEAMCADDTTIADWGFTGDHRTESTDDDPDEGDLINVSSFLPDDLWDGKRPAPAGKWDPVRDVIQGCDHDPAEDAFLDSLFETAEPELY